MDLRHLIAAVIILGIVACTPHSAMTHPQVTSEEAFLAEMVPHHQEAVATSRVMLDSENEGVRRLAQRIIDAQEMEIRQMDQWLGSMPVRTHTPAYTSMMPDLRTLSGKERDDAYLRGMIAHHEGAIAMAEQAQGYELRPAVRALTENIIATQTDEIEEITTLLAE